MGMELLYYIRLSFDKSKDNNYKLSIIDFYIFSLNLLLSNNTEETFRKDILELRNLSSIILNNRSDIDSHRNRYKLRSINESSSISDMPSINQNSFISDIFITQFESSSNNFLELAKKYDKERKKIHPYLSFTKYFLLTNLFKISNIVNCLNSSFCFNMRNSIVLKIINGIKHLSYYSEYKSQEMIDTHFIIITYLNNFINHMKNEIKVNLNNNLDNIAANLDIREKADIFNNIIILFRELCYNNSFYYVKCSEILTLISKIASFPIISSLCLSNIKLRNEININYCDFIARCFEQNQNMLIIYKSKTLEKIINDLNMFFNNEISINTSENHVINKELDLLFLFIETSKVQLNKNNLGNIYINKMKQMIFINEMKQALVNVINDNEIIKKINKLVDILLSN